jgi:Trehalose-6-phosphate synthase
VRTRESLQELVRNKLADYRFIIVSNREPYIHQWVGDQIVCGVPASGLTVALDPVMRACGGSSFNLNRFNASPWQSPSRGGIAKVI